MGISAWVLGILNPGQGGSEDKLSSEDNVQIDPEMESLQKIDKTRWTDLMYSLQTIAKLQRAATRARIDARQKRREASFRRQDVWVWDAKFMGEIQRLNAQGSLNGFEELSRLAAECQAARDLLGPLEQDNIEAESRWQGQIWKLKEAEEDLYTEFEEEFRDAAEYVEAHSGETNSSQQLSGSDGPPSDVSEDEDHETDPIDEATVPITEVDKAEDEDQIPLDFAYANTQEFENVTYGSDFDSGFGDLDSPLDTEPLVDVTKYGPPQPLPNRRHVGIEFHYKLLEDFSTRRERINSWLAHTVLESRLESVLLYSILQDLLKAEDQKMPSNWSQLVIAYWEEEKALVPASDGESRALGRHEMAAEHERTVKRQSADSYKEKTLKTEANTQHSSNKSLTTHIDPPNSEFEQSTTLSTGAGAPLTPIPIPSPPLSHFDYQLPSQDARVNNEPP